MQEFLQTAAIDGWRDAMHGYLRKRRPGVYRHANDESRADWRFYTNIDSSAVVADWGCGLGCATFVLARHCRQVYAIDTTLENVRYVALRAAQDELRNVTAIHGFSDHQYPIRPGTLDLVLLNGVLEWAAVKDNGIEPRRVQRDFLDSLRKLLKPSGEILIGIENRFGYPYMLGAPDEHTELRGITLLPRQIADIVHRMKLGRPYRTFTYSLPGYRRLLHAAGLELRRVLIPLPNYRFPEIILPAGDVAAGGYYLQRIASRRKIPGAIRQARATQRAFTAALNWFAHSYYLVAVQR